MTYSLKVSKVWFGFLIAVANSANAYLVPHIAPDYVAGFTAAVINALIVVFTVEEEQAPPP